MKATEKIEGYSEMSAEDKLKALESLEIEDSADVTKLKNLLSKANSESAEWRRKLNEKMTEQEKAEAERLESEKKIQEELAQLRKEKAISNVKNNYLSLGYDDATANEAAIAQVDGDTNALFEAQKKHSAAMKAALEKEKLGGQPKISGTSGQKANEFGDLDKLSDAEYYAATYKK